MAREIVWRLRIDWNLSGGYEGDESAYLLSAAGTMQLAAPEASMATPRGIVDDCTLTLDNSTGRYSPLNSSGPLYASLAGGGAYHAPMYLEVSINGGDSYVRVFTGVIKIPRETGATTREGATAILDCRSRDEILLTQRMSTQIWQFVYMHDNDYTEEDIIRQWLLDAGLSEGYDFVVDSGMWVIPWVWLDDESPIEEIWSLAAACGGRFYCDADGVFRYENASHWLMAPHTTSQETILANAFEQFEPRYEDRELYRAVTVEASERIQGISGVIWQAEQVITVPPSSTITVIAKLRQPTSYISGVTYSAISSGAVGMDSDVTIYTTQNAATVEFQISNANLTYAANLTTLALTGIPIDGRPAGEERAESTHAFWTNRQGRTRSLRGNVYIQNRAQAAMLAEFLRDRYQTPRLFYSVRGVPGDPARRPGDRITLQDSSLMTSSREVFVTSIRWSLGGHGFVQDLSCLDAAALYPDTNYFTLGSSLLGGSHSLFY